MLRTAVPASSASVRQSTPGRRSSPSASLSSAGSSPASTLSIKEQKQQQLQALQRQQQLHYQMEQQLDERYLTTDLYRQETQASSNGQKPKPSWASQEIKDTWINVVDEIDDKENSARWNRRLSHLSDKHMDTSATKLLEDETPPKIMDGSWGLDDLDDDHKHYHYDPRSITPPTATRLNEQNDRNITKNNNDSNINSNENNNHINDINKIKSAHGYVHMGKERATKSPIRSGSRGDTLDLRNGKTNVQPTSSKGGNGSKFPWRDTKHETIFTDLVDGQHKGQQLRDHDATTPRPQPVTRKSTQQDDHISDVDTSSSSLSLGDIIDAVNKGDESMDPARSSKFKQAKQRLAELSNSRDLQDLPDEYSSPTTDSSAGRTFQNNQEAFRQQRLRVINAATKIDLNDNRSLAPPGERRDTTHAAAASDSLKIQTATTPIKSQSNIPTSSRSSRFSYGSRHRSQACASRDTEIGDRGSTTSRDSVYRDSLSGSTLGSAGFQTQLEGIKKHEMATVLTVLNSAAVAQLFSESEDISRILPHNVNTKSPISNIKQEDASATRHLPPSVDIILSEDTDATPRPLHRTSMQGRRINPENDLARAKQYATLASRGLTKQSGSSVEELANATAMRSASDISFKNIPSPDSRKSERRMTSNLIPSTISEQRENVEFGDDDQQDRQKREVTFKSVPPIQQQEEDVAEKSDEEVEDLGSMAGSRAMEHAFKSLEDLDVSIDLMNIAKNDYSSRRAQTDDESAGDYLSSVMLPSKSKRRGDYSLKWENQLDTVSNADTSRLGFNTSISRSHKDSGMVAEQSSFSHAEGHLIRFITGLHPWDEWDQVKSLDLTKREVESTIRLNHLVPNLEILIMNDNQVPYLTGIPKTVKTLHVRSNLLDDLTNFSHLSNLQYLDISHNSIQDLTGLSCLVHLRELIAEGNKIKSLSALQQMDGLIRLDVSRNCLTSLDFRWSKLQRLEYLNASYNKIEQLENLESLVGLIHANLARNCIEDISLVQALRRLRILRLSENKLVTFDATPFPGLRTLYLDDNRLQNLENCQKLTRLENFSARDQEGEGIAIDMLEFINSRKLYLSGNPIHALYFEMGFYRLEYLEICAGCLSELPIDFATLFPNLRGLNLSYNGLDSISALDGLHRLRRLIFVGNNLKSFGDVLEIVKRMRSLVTLDLRHNPLTSNMYPAMSINQGSKYQDTYRTNQSSETELDWRRRDVGFRRALPDTMYVKRSVYRSAILKSCKRLEWFDGGSIQAKERERAPLILGDMLENYGWNYLANNRREDEEEEFEYDGENGEYYYDQQREADWLYNQGRLEQLNRDDEEDGEGDFVRGERDPEDITDDSKRQSSSVDSESLNGQHRLQQQQHPYAPKSPSRLSGVSQLQQPRKLRTLSGYQISSPSPKTLVPTARMNSSNSPSRRKSGKRPTTAEGPVDQQEQDDEEEVEDIQYEGSSDKRSAVRTWRDEVNEVSHRRSPRVRASIGSSGILSAAGSQEARSRSQQLRRSDKGSVGSGSSSGSSHGSQSGSTRAARNDTMNYNGQEISTIAVANNSGENRPSQERRPGARRFSIPALPPVHNQLQQQQHQSPSVIPHRPTVHVRGRSDSNPMTMMTPNGAPSAQQQGRQYSQGTLRPRSQHGMVGFENGEATPGQLQHQLSMSPMGGPSSMTASGTVLRPNNHRRRSSGLYGSRKMEVLGGVDLNTQSPNGNHGPMSMSMSAHILTQSPVASPGGYFGMTHQNMQSPFGKNSLPNTPSRGGGGGGGGGGRASRVSLGQGSHHYPQTLARDMELFEMEN
ncbi:hypothetical protein BGX27_007472 [Mortierella sp. AM989]|nr:hypothetical protein BGX27_007472 [Mortierella sp. AM989]